MFIFDKNKRNSKYFMKNIITYIPINKIKILYIEWNNMNGEQINKLINKSLNKQLICIYQKEKPKINQSKIPMYPVINANYLLFTPLSFTQINGIPNNINKLNDCKQYIFDASCKLMGIVLTKENIQYRNKYSYSGFREANFKGKIESELFVTKVIESFSVLPTLKSNHGWLSNDTNMNLKYVIQKYNPKNILELGTWFGKSTRHIKKYAPDANLYCFDKFQNIAKSPYTSNKFNPLDKFYFSLPRFETVYNILSEYKNCYLVQYNAYDAIKLMKKWNIEIDMIFIDFIKSKHKLIKFLEEINKEYPDAIIVGDDIVFETVKQALYNFISVHQRFIGILPESYIISSKKLIDYSIILDNSNKYYKNKKLKEKGENKQYIHIHVIYLFNKARFKEAFEIVTKYKLDMNKRYENIIRNGTLYHVLCKALYQAIHNEKDKMNKFQMFAKYQKPKDLEDDFLLTYKDYLNYNINMN